MLRRMQLTTHNVASPLAVCCRFLSSDATVVKQVTANKVTTLTLANPKRRNALSREMISVLQQKILSVKDDPSVSAVVINAEGPVFSAGHDLKEISQLSTSEHQKLFAECCALMKSIIECPVPVIASVSGLATAAGCQLVATCDLAIAATTASFATPGVNIGLFCSTPAVALARNVGRKAALEMLFTGEPISAERALKLGLVNAVVPPAQLEEQTKELTDVITSKSREVLGLGKQQFYRQIEMNLECAYNTSGHVMVENLKHEDGVEGIAAFIQKRPPVWSEK